MILITLKLLFIAICCEGTLLKEVTVHEVVLDVDNNYLVRWSPKQDEVIFEIQVATHGYIGFGFSPTGGMTGADMILGWVCSKGIPHISDRHGVGNTMPVEDYSQDYTLLGGYRNSTHSVILFSRPWTTCDHDQDYQLSSDTVKVIWSYSKTGPLEGNFPYHDRRGAKSMYLQEPRVMSVPNTPDVKYMDITAPNVLVPSDRDTLYYCFLIKVPDLMEKHHFIGYTLLVDEIHKPFFHHMLLHECHDPDSYSTFEKDLHHPGADCSSRNMPPSWKHCQSPIVVWAIGSEGEMLPDHVGIPLHERHGGATYFVAQIHYDNPFLKEIRDNSGVRIYYTDQIRQYEAATLTTGHATGPMHLIPPVHSWVTVGHCPPSHTAQHIPKDGINVISALLHSHLLGRKLKAQLVRNGRELEPLFIDNNYDFDYQQVRVLNKERIILPGDHIISSCVYNSSAVNDVTFGGESTREEMCLVFLYYYPRIDLTKCLSVPTSENIMDSINVEVDLKTKLKKEYVHKEEYRSIRLKNGKDKNAYDDVMCKTSTWRNESLIRRLQHNVIYGDQTIKTTFKSSKNTQYDIFKYADYISFKSKSPSCTLGTTKDGYKIIQEGIYDQDQHGGLDHTQHKDQDGSHQKHYKDLKQEIKEVIKELKKEFKLKYADSGASTSTYHLSLLPLIFCGHFLYYYYM